VLKKELFTEDGHRRIVAENIFNVDETRLTVNQKPRKVIVKKGKKSVSVMKSIEKAKLLLRFAAFQQLVFTALHFWSFHAEGLVAGLMRQHFHKSVVPVMLWSHRLLPRSVGL